MATPPLPAGYTEIEDVPPLPAGYEPIDGDFSGEVSVSGGYERGGLGGETAEIRNYEPPSLLDILGSNIAKVPSGINTRVKQAARTADKLAFGLLGEGTEGLARLFAPALFNDSYLGVGSGNIEKEFDRYVSEGLTPSQKAVPDVIGFLGNPLNRGKVINWAAKQTPVLNAIGKLGKYGDRLSTGVRNVLPNWLQQGLGVGKIAAPEAALYYAGEAENPTVTGALSAATTGGAIGALGGSILNAFPAAARSVFSSEPSPIRRRAMEALEISGVSPQEVRNQLTEYQRMKRAGAPVVAADMFSAATGKDVPAVRSVFKQVGDTAVGSKILRGMPRAQPEASEARLRNILEQIAPASSYDDAAKAVRQGADDAARNIQDRINKQFTPRYEAAYRQTPIITAGRFEGGRYVDELEELVGKSEVLQRSFKDAKKVSDLAELPWNSSRVVNQVLHDMSDNIRSLKSGANPDYAEAKRLAREYDKLNEIVEARAPKLYKTRQAYSKVAEARDSFTAGVLKDVNNLKEGQVVQVGNKLFGTNSTPAKIAKFREALGEDADKVMRPFVREHIERLVRSKDKDDMIQALELALKKSNTEKLRAALGGGQQADDILDRLKVETLINVQDVLSGAKNLDVRGGANVLNDVKDAMQRLTSPFTLTGRAARFAAKKLLPRNLKKDEIDRARQIFSEANSEEFLKYLAKTYPDFRLGGREAVQAAGRRGAPVAGLVGGAVGTGVGVFDDYAQDVVAPAVEKIGERVMDLGSEFLNEVPMDEIQDRATRAASDVENFTSRAQTELQPQSDLGQRINESVNYKNAPNLNYNLLLEGIAQVESSGGKNKTGPVIQSGPYKGEKAKGRWQVLDPIGKDYFKRLGGKDFFEEQGIKSTYDPYDDEQQRIIAEAIIKDNLRMAKGDVELALLYYHTGYGNVKKGKIGPVGKAYPGKVKQAIKRQL